MFFDLNSPLTKHFLVPILGPHFKEFPVLLVLAKMSPLDRYSGHSIDITKYLIQQTNFSGPNELISFVLYCLLTTDNKISDITNKMS